VLRRSTDRVLVVFGRWVAHENVRQPVQQRQFVLDQLLLLAREQRARLGFLIFTAGTPGQLEYASTHQVPIILRVPGR
jgi:hypothetical protein